MFREKLYSSEELTQMIDNTRGFFDYVKIKERIKQDEDLHGAFSWIFDATFISPPLRLSDPNMITETDIYVIDKIIRKTFRRAWGTPPEFRAKMGVYNSP